MQKTEEEVIKALKHGLLDIKNLYKSYCIKWTGKIKGTDIYCTEFISDKLLEKIKMFDKIPAISRMKTYCTNSHLNPKISKTNRHEENFAKQITGVTLNGLGTIIDYQVPLKNKQSEKAGKIDLISFNETTKILYLIELKHGNNNETLLRAILEIYTYYKIIDKEKLKNDYFNNKDFILELEVSPININEINVMPAVLLTQNTYSYKELQKIDTGENPKLKTLIKNLGVCCFAGDFVLNIRNESMIQKL